MNNPAWSLWSEADDPEVETIVVTLGLSIIDVFKGIALYLEVV